MKCRYCQAQMSEEDKLCPECGKAQEEETPAVEEAAAEEKPLPFDTEGYEKPGQTEIKEGIKATPGKIALAVVAVVVILAVLVALIVSGLGGEAGGEGVTIAPTSGTVAATDAAAEPEETVPATIPADGNPNDVTCKGTYTVTDDEILAAADTVVATLGDRTLTNGQLQVYYWSEALAYYEQYGDSAIAFGLDFSKPLDTQICPLSADVSMTWQQFFLRTALDNWHCYNSLLMEADAEGYVPEEAFQQYLVDLPQALESAAIANGAASAEELVDTMAGAGCTVEDYIDYVAVYNESNLYYNVTCAELTATEAEVEAHFTENQAEYETYGVTKDSGKYVDVRHILIMPEDENATTGEDGYPVYSDEAWAVCEAEAQRIYDEWKAGDLSEESFAQYAMDYSVDGSASVGGLYEDVYQGQMVENFENWCFDEARQVGDHGLVKTQYGYHIMYYVGSTDIWYATAELDVIDSKAAEIIPAAMAKYALEVDYSVISLGLADFQN